VHDLGAVEVDLADVGLVVEQPAQGGDTQTALPVGDGTLSALSRTAICRIECPPAT
jgi:hypothetical protein